MSEGTEVSAETAIGNFKLSGAGVNTIATFITLVLVALLCILLYQHIGQADKRDEGLSKAFQEMAQAQREQNCLISIPEAQREAKADFCKRITK